MTEWTRAEFDRAAKLKERGKTSRQIAEVMPGRTPTAIGSKLFRGRPASFGQKQWTEAETEELARRVANKESAAKIARAMGKTRNSIIGKITRMGERLNGGRGDGQRPIKRSPVTIHHKSSETPAAPLYEPITTTETDTPGIPNPGMCKYPVSGEKADVTYCQNRKTDRSYCDDHQQICYARDMVASGRGTGHRAYRVEASDSERVKRIAHRGRISREQMLSGAAIGEAADLQS